MENRNYQLPINYSQLVALISQLSLEDKKNIFKVLKESILNKKKSREGFLDSYQASMDVLSKDWDQQEDDHWDNY